MSCREPENEGWLDLGFLLNVLFSFISTQYIRSNKISKEHVTEKRQKIGKQIPSSYHGDGMVN